MKWIISARLNAFTSTHQLNQLINWLKSTLILLLPNRFYACMPIISSRSIRFIRKKWWEDFVKRSASCMLVIYFCKVTHGWLLLELCLGLYLFGKCSMSFRKPITRWAMAKEMRKKMTMVMNHSRTWVKRIRFRCFIDCKDIRVSYLIWGFWIVRKGLN